MKATAPNCCPVCQRGYSWKRAGVTQEGVSVGKAVVGGVLAGGTGALLGGLSGKKKYVYACSHCGFQNTYDNACDFIKYDKAEDYEDALVGETKQVVKTTPKTEKEKIREEIESWEKINHLKIKSMDMGKDRLSYLEANQKSLETKKTSINLDMVWATEEKKEALREDLIKLCAEIEENKKEIEAEKQRFEKNEKDLKDNLAKIEALTDKLYPSIKLKKEKKQLIGEKIVLESEMEKSEKSISILRSYEENIDAKYKKYKTGKLLGWCTLVLIGLSMVIIGLSMVLTALSVGGVIPVLISMLGVGMFAISCYPVPVLPVISLVLKHGYKSIKKEVVAYTKENLPKKATKEEVRARLSAYRQKLEDGIQTKKERIKVVGNEITDLDQRILECESKES